MYRLESASAWYARLNAAWYVAVGWPSSTTIRSAASCPSIRVSIAAVVSRVLSTLTDIPSARAAVVICAR